MSQKEIVNYKDEEWEFVITDFPTKRCVYYISNYGRIKSVRKDNKVETILKGSILKRSQHRVLRIKLKGDVQWGVYIHKFVATHFVDKKSEDQKFVIHKDGNKQNNHFSNLEWKNQQELFEWQKAIGSFVLQDRSKKIDRGYKMTVAKVKLLKRRLKEGKTKKKILAKSFNITPMQLNRIERGENWGHVTIDDE